MLVVGGLHPGGRLRTGVHRRRARRSRASWAGRWRSRAWRCSTWSSGAIALGMSMRRMKRVQLMQGSKEEVSRSIASLAARRADREDRLIRREKEFGQDTGPSATSKARTRRGQDAAVLRGGPRRGGGRTLARTRRAVGDRAARGVRAPDRLARLGREAARGLVLGAAIVLGFLLGYRQRRGPGFEQEVTPWR